MSMNKKYMKCPPDLPLMEAAKLLIGVGKKNLVVVDSNNYVLGTISASDILKCIIIDPVSAKTNIVSDVMQTDFVYLNIGCSKEDIKKIFSTRYVFYIPILDNDRKLVDMVFLVDYI
jgi:predicted transcriptional regulator